VDPAVTKQKIKEFKAREKQRKLQLNRPYYSWPHSFEITLSTNEFAFNITEIVYFVSLLRMTHSYMFGTCRIN